MSDDDGRDVNSDFSKQAATGWPGLNTRLFSVVDNFEHCANLTVAQEVLTEPIWLLSRALQKQQMKMR